MASASTNFAGIDPTAPFASSFTQPAAVVMYITMAACAMSQKLPRDFLPPRYVGRVINGFKAERLLLMPLGTIVVFYGAVAEQLNVGHNVRGHAAGFAVSMASAAGCLAAWRVSPYYWGLFTLYSIYGMVHHLRKLILYTDQAPWFQRGDFAVVRQHLATKREKRLQQERRRDLLRESRGLAPLPHWKTPSTWHRAVTCLLFPTISKAASSPTEDA